MKVFLKLQFEKWIIGVLKKSFLVNNYTKHRNETAQLEELNNIGLLKFFY